MNRKNISYLHGQRFSPSDPVAVIRPPVFKTTLDAWHHFVRHPEEFPVYDLPDDLDPVRSFGAGDDIFDRMDSFQNALSRTDAINRPSESAGSVTPAAASQDEQVPASGNATQGEAAEGVEIEDQAT